MRLPMQALCAAVAVFTVVSCVDEPSPPSAARPSPTATGPRSLSEGPEGASRPAGAHYILIEGRKYLPKIGRLRGDLLDLERLQPQSVEAQQGAGWEWQAEPIVYGLPTVSVEDAVLLRFPPNMAPATFADQTPPACYTRGVSVFTALGAEPSPRPFS